jgi:ribosomal protein L12E/L44/L45/RPP1/RPP2
MKTIFASVLAAAFLLSQPAFAGDEAKDKAAKTEKKDTKKEEKKDEKKAEKGGW